MADHVDPHDETPSAPFRRVLSLIDSLSPRFKPSDETPLREAMPGGWPTIGEFRSFMKTIEPPPPSSHVMGRWLPIEQADKTINHVTEFTQIGLTLKNSDTFWVRDEDGRVYEAAWSEGNKGRDYWWDWEAESPVDPVEFMPHPLDPRWSALATTEGSTDE